MIHFVGLHLNLTEGRPVNKSVQYKTLVNKDGFLLGKFGLQTALDKAEIDLSEVSFLKIASYMLIYHDYNLINFGIIAANGCIFNFKDDFSVGTS